jgi:CRISPR/Cas system-associated exonuclease Cas4 (RecB family)
MPERRLTRQSAAAVWGLFEHDIFRVLSTSLKKTWKQAGSVDVLYESSCPDIDEAIDFTLGLVKQNFPQFFTIVESNIAELQYRIKAWIRNQGRVLKEQISSGKTIDSAISELLPWKVEVSLESRELGLRGRTDALYLRKGMLVPEDIKTHESRFSTLLQEGAHKTQLACYSVMSEEKFNIQSEEARIFHTRDLTYKEYSISNDEKHNLIKNIDSARDILDEDLPSILSGQEAIKCRHCYARELCFSIHREQTDRDASGWLDRLMNSNPTAGGLFGGN